MVPSNPDVVHGAGHNSNHLSLTDKEALCGEVLTQGRTEDLDQA